MSVSRGPALLQVYGKYGKMTFTLLWILSIPNQIYCNTFL